MKRMQKIINLMVVICLMLALVPMQAFAATKNEAWLQEQIDSGATEIYIDDPIVLENDYVIKNHVKLILRNGSITVPAGRTLTNNTAQINVWETARITVENGATFINRSEIITDGTFAVHGTFEGIVHTYYWTNQTNATIIGVPDSDIWMHYVVEEGNAEANQAKFLENWALMESTNYGRYSQQIHGDLTLPEDLEIPVNCWFVLEVRDFTLTIPEDVTVTNFGYFSSYADQTVANYGTFANSGSLDIRGSWTGNQPVMADVAQEQLENALIEANATGIICNLNGNCVLERDLVIDGNNLGLAINGRLTVPNGVTLTIGNGGYMQVGQDGVLDVQGDIQVNYTNDWPYRINLFYWDGEVSTVAGVPNDYLILNCPVSNELELQDALSYVDRTNFGIDFVRVNNSITLTQNITIPANTCLRLQNGAVLTIPADCTLTHNGLEVQIYEGHQLRNNGTIQNNSDFWIYGTGKLVNNGTFYNNGQVHLNGYWEGNQPIVPHEHTYTQAVTQPTCTEAGYITYTCSICDYSYNGDYIYATGLHTFDNDQDTACNTCGHIRELREARPVVHMFRMYDPNSGEHFYTGSEEERENLVKAGWNYEGVGFTFPLTTGKPVYRLYDKNNTYEHLYTMDETEKTKLMNQGWVYEGIAFNSGFEDEVPQYRLHNPNETRGAYHFTFSLEERENLLAAGWEYQGIGWYSCWK